MYYEIENITARQLGEYIDDAQYLVVDLREKEEYLNLHVRNAIQVDISEILSGNFTKINKKNVILYCSRGGESIRMARILGKNGYSVKSVIGGFREIQKFHTFLIK